MKHDKKKNEERDREFKKIKIKLTTNLEQFKS